VFSNISELVELSLHATLPTPNPDFYLGAGFWFCLWVEQVCESVQGLARLITERKVLSVLSSGQKEAIT
jgi:hypothetical protein